MEEAMMKSMRDAGMGVEQGGCVKGELQKPVFVHRKASAGNISKIHEHFSFKKSSKA
jgi:hypothetical protein